MRLSNVRQCFRSLLDHGAKIVLPTYGGLRLLLFAQVQYGRAQHRHSRHAVKNLFLERTNLLQVNADSIRQLIGLQFVPSLSLHPRHSPVPWIAKRRQSPFRGERDRPGPASANASQV
jgi:hypothetical protein